MECNKDEASRAKGIAENKLKKRDFTGAKRFALKAQRLFPDLEGLPQLLSVINVYDAHEHKINGEVDYYGILGVDPSSNEEIIRKQYNRLLLCIHPDKNKLDGAAGAFMILLEAWRVLSSKDERRVYDTKLNLRATNQASSFSSTTHATSPAPVFTRPSTPGSFPSQPRSSSHHPGNIPSGSHFHYPPTHQWTPPAETAAYSQYTTPPQAPLYPSPGTPLSSNQQSSARNPPPIPEHRKSPTTASAAQDVPAPRPNFRFARFKKKSNSSTCSPRSDTFWTGCDRCKTKYEYLKIYLDRNLLCPRCQKPFLAVAMPAPPARKQKKDPVVASGGPTNMPPSVTQTSQAAQGPENLGTASSPVSGGPHREKPVKRRRKDGQACVGAKESQGAAGHSRVKRASANATAYFEAKQRRSAEELSNHQMRIILIGKVKQEILNQLNKWESAKSDSPHLKRANTRKDTLDDLDQVGSDIRPSTDGLSKDSDNLFPEVDAPDEYESMVVPDANFHNFDNARIEESFTEGQIWAAYDDDDGMPRLYALVQHVLSRSPFKIQISWLNSKTTSEFGPLDWTDSGFTKTSGNFRTGKSLISKRLNSFSHPIKSVKGERGVIRIFPTKGDVWALYRNWSPTWNETTAYEIIHKYDVVVVLEDYTDDTGVLVAPLVKVPGFTSVFKQVLDQREIQTISREEMFSFSHQVPFHILSGLEAENTLKNCYELDPAALPLELLNVTTDLDSAEKRVSEQPHVQEGSSEDIKPVLKYSRRNKEKKTDEDFFQSLISESLDAVFR